MGGGDLRPRGPRYWTPIGAARAMRTDPLDFLDRMATEHGDAVCVGMGPGMRAWFFFHPAAVKHVLVDNHQNYVKGFVVGRVKEVLGEGLFTNEGDSWRRQRRLAQPAFHRDRIAAFARAMARRTAERLEGWGGAAADGGPVDVAAEMNALALSIVGDTLFGRDLAGEAAEAGAALGVALGIAAERALSYLPAPLWVPTAKNRALRSAIGTLDALVYEIIAARRRAASPGDDLLGMLMAARDEESGEAMSPRQLRDEVMTFLLAGHETTAVALAWTWDFLARHPDVAERARDEVLAVLADRPPATEDLPRMPLARMVVEEAMRLRPPVWGISRQAIADDVVAGHRVRAGSLVSLSAWVTHRHPALWEAPDRFDPERFRPTTARPRPRFAYFPFGGGPRLCIGEAFAMMEAQIVVAMTLQRYRLSLVDDRPAVPEPTLTLRPRDGVHMRVERVAACDGRRLAS